MTVSEGPVSQGTASQGTATQLGSDALAAAPSARVPGLSVLYHPDLGRAGDRAPLPALGSGRRAGLSRREPLFLSLGRSESPRPLDSPRLSRRPLELTDAGGGAVRLRRGESRTSVVAAGTPLEDERTFPAEAVDEGVVLLLGGSVVLLLHRLDPLPPPAGQDFGLVGESPAMLELRQDVVRVADLEVPVLLRGETGTGKELAARAVHEAGPRRRGPFVAVNLAALPPALAAAELFGAARGAFTGADRDRPGYFARARGGTLFLDEIGEAPAEVQVLLLRCLETGRFQPVGGDRPVDADVRIVAATDADLEAAAAQGRFRAPLLHRLAGYTLRLPPLRRRREDFGLLLAHFLRRELAAVGELHRLDPGRPPWLPAPVVADLARAPWPGNVRQLANAVRQLVIANRGRETFELREPLEALLGTPPPPTTTTTWAPPDLERKPADVPEAELREALKATGWRPQAAARRLGIPRPSVYDLIAKSPTLRTAADLTQDEIEASHERHDGRVEAMAAELEVSVTALRRRLR